MARLGQAVRLNRQWQPLEDVVGSALNASATLLAGRRSRSLAPDLLPLLQFDAVLIRRVFCNLLENAAKYTPPGTPVDIEAHAETDFVVVTVNDHGPGLPITAARRRYSTSSSAAAAKTRPRAWPWPRDLPCDHAGARRIDPRVDARAGWCQLHFRLAARHTAERRWRHERCAAPSLPRKRSAGRA